MCRGRKKFDGSSTLVCPACNKTIHVGFGGEKNLVIHCTSKACQNKSRKRHLKDSRPTQDLHKDLGAFFKPRAPLNPPTVTVPLPIHTDKINSNARTKDEVSHETSNVGVSCNDPGKTLETAREMRRLPSSPSSPPSLKAGTSPCQKGIELLNRLEVCSA